MATWTVMHTASSALSCCWLPQSRSICCPNSSIHHEFRYSQEVAARSWTPKGLASSSLRRSERGCLPWGRRVFKAEAVDPEEQLLTSEDTTSDDGKNKTSSDEGRDQRALRNLNSYFEKLTPGSTTTASAGSSEPTPASSSHAAAATVGTSSQSSESTTSSSASEESSGKVSEHETKDRTALRSLNRYFDKLNPPQAPTVPEALESKREDTAARTPAKAETDTTPAVPDFPEEFKAKVDLDLEGDESIEDYEEALKAVQGFLRPFLKGTDIEITERQGDSSKLEFQITTKASLLNSLPNDGAFVASLLLAVNVAVFLFELASPDLVPGNIMTSLPCLYGAKVNVLIAAGEWWRLLTPTFLHAGFLHLIVSSYILMSLGTRVEIAYSKYAFLALYVTGGVFGNLFSFLNTPGVTIGGTGPMYALAAAWVVFLAKNRDSLDKSEVDDEIFWKITLFALNLAFGNSLPIDDWSHIGGLVGGIVFGLLAAPSISQNPLPLPPGAIASNPLDAEAEKDKAPKAKTKSKKLSSVEVSAIFALCMGLAACTYELGTSGALQSLQEISPDMLFF